MAATLLLGPGLPLLFMGEEYGETHPFLYFTSQTDSALAKAGPWGGRTSSLRTECSKPDPLDVSTFENSKLSHRRDGEHGALRDAYRQLLALRRHNQGCIAAEWPRVRMAGRTLTLERSSFTLDVNLGPQLAAGLGPWEWRGSDRSQRE